MLLEVSILKDIYEAENAIRALSSIVGVEKALLVGLVSTSGLVPLPESFMGRRESGDWQRSISVWGWANVDEIKLSPTGIFREYGLQFMLPTPGHSLPLEIAQYNLRVDSLSEKEFLKVVNSTCEFIQDQIEAKSLGVIAICPYGKSYSNFAFCKPVISNVSP